MLVALLLQAGPPHRPTPQLLLMKALPPVPVPVPVVPVLRVLIGATGIW